MAGGNALSLRRFERTKHIAACFRNRPICAPIIAEKISASSASSAVKILHVKTLVFFLCLTVALSDVSRSATLRAGAATSNSTPHLGTSLDGTITQNGPAAQIHDELHARCLVLDDGTTRIALVVCDSTMIAREIYDHAKALIESNYGIPANRVLVSATHSHATPIIDDT